MAAVHKQAVQVRDEVLTTLRNCDKPYDEALTAVPLLARKFRLGIIANQMPDARERLANIGLLPYFKVLALPDKVRISEPDLRLFRLALREAACSSGETTMVGDRVMIDVAPAKSLRMKGIRLA